MSVFQNYSQYYDLLYKQKDYPAEAAFIRQVIKKYSPHRVKEILSLGCGTCNHDLLLAQKGYQLNSLDLSPTMLKLARKKINSAGVSEKVTLHQADVRRFNLNHQHDFAMAMFNVIGYQTSNQDINDTLSRINEHLRPEGLFLFDCWYAPAVVADPPTDRIREVMQGENRIIRLTQSTLFHQKNIIEIKFHLLILKDKKVLDELTEIHQMRYWTLPEMSQLLAVHDFKLIKACPFLKLNGNISDSEWDMFIIAQKK